MQDTESAAACAGHCNQCILPLPFLPWIYLLPLPYPQHQACFQKFPRLLHKDGDPRPSNWYGQQQELAWHHRNEYHKTLVRTMRLTYIPVCTSSYCYVHQYTTWMFYLWYVLVCTGMYLYVPVHTCTYLYCLHIVSVVLHALRHESLYWYVMYYEIMLSYMTA